MRWRAVISTLLAFLLGLSAAAKTDSLTVKPLWHNWNFTLTTGGDVFFHPGGQFRGRLMPSADLVFGKEFSPYGGARLGLQWGGLSLWGTSPKYKSMAEKGVFRDQNMYNERVDFLYLHGDVLWNLTNTLLGYREDRLFTFSPYMHFGFFVETGKGRLLEKEFASGAGLLGEWRISPQWTATLDIRAALYTGAVSIDRSSGRLVSVSALGGMTWHPLAGWQRFKPGVALHNGFWDNWFLSAMGGVNTIGVYHGFKGAQASGWDFSAGKWFSPAFALRAGWQGGQFAGRGRKPLRYVEAIPDGDLFLERFRFDYAHGDVLWNWLPYSPRNRWATGPYVHMGFLVERGPKGGLIGRHYAGGPGWYTRFSLVPGLDLQLDFRGFLLNSGTAGDAAGGIVLAGSALAGLSYTLGRPGWDRWNPVDKPRKERIRKPGQPYQIGRFAENWSTRLMLGATRNSLAADLSVTKWFTPKIGLRAGYQGVSLTERTTTLGFAYLHQDLIVSAIDLLLGYNPQRRIKLDPYLHFGVIAEYDAEAVPFKGLGYEYAGGIGLSASVALDRHLGLAAEFRETLLTANATPVPGHGIGRAPSVLLGLEYAFGDRTWRSTEQTSRTGERMSRFWDNWFASGAVGVNGFTGIEAWNSRSGLAVDVSLGKWFSPQFGVRGGLQGLRLARVGTNPRNGVYAYPETDELLREELGFAYLHGDFLWNFTHTVLPYQETRLWTVVPYMHMGAMVEFGVANSSKGIFERELAEGIGLLQFFRLDDGLDVFLDLRTTVTRGQASGDLDSRVGLIPTALLGLTGHIGSRGFDTVEKNAPAPEPRNEKARWAVSLNLADAALLGTAGGSLQWSPTRHLSVENSIRLNALSFRNNTLYDQRQTFSTAVRWWPWHVYAGFYVRASAQVETARRQGIPLFSTGAGEAYGAGLSAGYSLLLSRHLNIEFGAGLWGGRLRKINSLERSWFVAPDGLTLALVFVL